MNTLDQVTAQFAQPEETYSKVELFGGAMTCDLPSSFGDVSSIRDVPDNQEVYLHRTQLTSIVFDILERVERPGHPVDTDEQALLYHYKDITEEGHVRQGTESEELSQTWECGQIVVPSLGSKVPAYSLFATQRPQQQPPAAAQSGKPPVDFVAVLMTLIRLEKQKTDLIITVNVPHAQGEYDSSDIDFGAKKIGPLVIQARQHQARLLETFRVEDWSLFVQE